MQGNSGRDSGGNVSVTVTLATGCDSWIRVDGPYDDPNGIDGYGNRLVPFCVRRTVFLVELESNVAGD
jgi:hypothetical protein